MDSPQIVEVQKKIDPAVDIEAVFGNMLRNSSSGTGEEELLRIASNYSMQLTGPQMKLMLFLEMCAYAYEQNPHFKHTGKMLRAFIAKWLELKQYNNSDVFIMRALDSFSLKRFLNENSFKVNIDK